MHRSGLGLFSAALVTALATPVFAGEAPLSAGQVEVNVGVGLEDARLPLYAGVDVAVHRDVTVGGDVFIAPWGGGIGLLGRGDYHWNRLLDIPRNADLYLGGGLGFSGHGLWPHAQLGGRWFFSEHVGLNLELGGGSFFDGMFGITVKLAK
jgi:hypothetical protein